jgi:hypothetical protein
VWSPRTQLERRVTLDAVAGQQLGDPSLRDVVIAGNVAPAATFNNDGGDNEASE